MVQARTAGRPGRSAAPPQPGTRLAHTDNLREHIAELLLQAAEFISPAQLAPVSDGRYVWVGGATPLDEAGLAVSRGFVRPGARGPLP